MLYDHLTQKKGMSKEEALDVIAEEFVNYNRLPGRGRDFLESMGLMWFYNYKLRIMKIAVKMVRERPATALFFASGVEPLLNIDTVFSGSLAGNLYDGSYEYSLGPQMGFDALWLNPWVNLTQ